MVAEAVIRCLRCGREPAREFCWYCLGRLCVACWAQCGHCGHAEADAINLEGERCR